MSRKRLHFHLQGRALRPIAGLYLLTILLCPAATSRAATPALSLAPDRGPCTSRVTIRGSDLPPGQAVALSARQTSPPTHQGLAFATTTVAADGSFTLDADMGPLINGCTVGQPPPAGTQYTIFAADDTGRGGSGNVLATAIFTVSASPVPPGLPNTGGGGARSVSQLWLLGLGAFVLPWVMILRRPRRWFR